MFPHSRMFGLCRLELSAELSRSFTVPEEGSYYGLRLAESAYQRFYAKQVSNMVRRHKIGTLVFQILWALRNFAKASLLTLLCRLCWVPGYAVTVKEMPFSPRHCPQSPAWMPADAEHVDRSPKIRCLPVPDDNQIQHLREKSLSLFTFIYKKMHSQNYETL